MANDPPKKKRKTIEKLRNKYRLVILNDDTFEEKLSLKLSRLNVFFIIGFLTIFLITSTVFLIAFTPLREYIPGYSSTAVRSKAFKLALATDSLEQQLNYNQRYLLNIRKIVEGNPPLDFSDTAMTDDEIKAELNRPRTKQDSLLRLMVEEEERFNLTPGGAEIGGLGNLYFFTPVKGIISQHFNPRESHWGTDIVAKKDEIIKAAQNGIVIFSEWTAETGYVVILQHPGDFLSVYKHNSALLKSQGESVRAGDPIAVIGNSGELTTGPHLHFELWFNGNPVDAENYLSF